MGLVYGSQVPEQMKMQELLCRHQRGCQEEDGRRSRLLSLPSSPLLPFPLCLVCSFRVKFVSLPRARGGGCAAVAWLFDFDGNYLRTCCFTCCLIAAAVAAASTTDRVSVAVASETQVLVVVRLSSLLRESIHRGVLLASGELNDYLPAGIDDALQSARRLHDRVAARDGTDGVEAVLVERVLVVQ